MDKIKILMAASEAIPYMKTGGLADVANFANRWLIRMNSQQPII